MTAEEMTAKLLTITRRCLESGVATPAQVCAFLQSEFELPYEVAENLVVVALMTGLPDALRASVRGPEWHRVW